MTGIDIGILAIIGIAAVISFMRGFVTEVVSLATWVAALVVATLYAHPFGTLFRNQIDHDMARGAAAWVFLFVTTLLLGALINFLFSKLRAAAKLGPIDRTVGFLFGFGKGCLIVTVIVLAAHLAVFSSLRGGDLWNNSKLIPYFTEGARALHNFLPESQRSFFGFEQAI